MIKFQEIADVYNDKVDGVKRIRCNNEITIEDLFDLLKDAVTAFGKPHLAQVTFIKGKSIVIGPNMWGDYIIVYKSGDDFYVSVQSEQFFIKKDKAKKEEIDNYKSDKLDYEIDRLDNEYESDAEAWLNKVFYSIDIYALYEKISRFIEQYIASNNVVYENYKYIPGKFYRLEDNTERSGNSYILTDLEDNNVYDIDGCMPYKSFRIFDHMTGCELVKVVRRWRIYYTIYDFYKDDNKYGTFVKKASFSNSDFLMSSLDGQVSMRKSEVKGGAYYIVKVKDEIVGIIVEQLSSLLENPDLDVCIIQVKNERFKNIVAALATMIVSNSNNDSEI